MAPAPPGVDQFDSVVDAARQMRASANITVPVTGERTRFLGMVSGRDIIDHSVADGQNPNAVTIGSLVQWGQLTLDPDRIADQAVLALIVAHPFAELPVVQNGRLVGMLNVADLAVPLLEQSDDDSRELWPDDCRR
jgi:CBS domain-containing protein